MVLDYAINIICQLNAMFSFKTQIKIFNYISKTYRDNKLIQSLNSVTEFFMSLGLRQENLFFVYFVRETRVKIEILTNEANAKCIFNKSFNN